jgi:uncharacterized protein YbcI
MTYDEEVQEPARSDEGRLVLSEVSDEMVRIYKEQFGRGPTKARTDWAGPDVLICTLQDSFTQAEKNLVALGEDQRLRDMRMFFQYATEDEFRGSVERIIGRDVVGFVSGLDARRDISTEVFYFEPRR